MQVASFSGLRCYCLYVSIPFLCQIFLFSCSRDGRSGSVPVSELAVLIVLQDTDPCPDAYLGWQRYGHTFTSFATWVMISRTGTRAEKGTQHWETPQLEWFDPMYSIRSQSWFSRVGRAKKNLPCLQAARRLIFTVYLVLFGVFFCL